MSYYCKKSDFFCASVTECNKINIDYQLVTSVYCYTITALQL